MEVSEAGLPFCPILTNFLTTVLPCAVSYLGIAAEHRGEESFALDQPGNDDS